MKWLSIFKKKRSKAEAQQSDEDKGSPEEDSDNGQCHKRRSLHVQHREPDGKRTSLEQWFEARKARTSIDINNTTTTEKLTVCKAGITTLINRTYIVVKHLGSGTYGQVKLAFNLRDKKLYAIKACRKSQLGGMSPIYRSSSSFRSNSRPRRSFGQQPASLSPLGPTSIGSNVGIDSSSANAVQVSIMGCAAAAAAAAAAVAVPASQLQAFAPGAMQEALARIKAEEFVREIAIMKKLTHPNIVKLVEVIDDPGSDNLLLVMEYVEGETLQPRKLSSARWEAVPEFDVWRRTRDVLQGLDYLHLHQVVHGDLKPANLMLDTNTRQVKIVDFGSAVLNGDRGPLAGSGLQGMSCTPAFRSPESLNAGYRPSFELDMWALGVTIYMWIFGELPFTGVAPFLVYENIRKHELRLPEHTTISTELCDFLRGLLEKDPAARLDVVAALKHPWVTGNGSAPLPVLERIPSTSLSPEASSNARSAMQMEYVRSVSQEELQLAISESIGGDAMSELMGMVFEEIRFQPRQQIITVGDPVDRVYLIAQGEVEIYHDHDLGGENGEAQADHLLPIISGVQVNMDSGGEEEDLVVGFLDAAKHTDWNGSGHAFGSHTSPVFNNAPKISRMSHSSSLTNLIQPMAVLAVKGPGDSLGLTSLEPKTFAMQKPVWRANVRAKGEVVAFKADVENIHRLVRLYPELESAMKHIAVQQETDLMVVEALRQLRLMEPKPQMQVVAS